MKSGKIALILACFAFSGPALAQDGMLAERIDQLARRTVDEFHITGLSITVVTSDEVLFAKSYGLREAGGDVAVDTDTIFPFGSIGKALTATTLAMLVDEGKLDWDDPVRDYIPEFEMSDPYITREFSIRDALTHRSGLPLGAGDLLFVPDGDPEISDVLAALKYIQPETSFRSEFAYDNMMYIVAGEVVARVEDKPWAQVVRERIFDPLDMDSCIALPSLAALAENTVTQHGRPSGSDTAEPIDPSYMLPDTAASAGGVSCSITDLGKWTQFWLRGGTTISGQQLVSENQIREMWTGVTPFPVSAGMRPARTHFALYALGWGLYDFYGDLLVAHKGGTMGAVSHVALLPDRNVGVFITTNDMFPAIPALSYQILNEYAGFDPETDWLALAEESYAQFLDVSGRDAVMAETLASEPTRALSAYEGTYKDPWYGEVSVVEQNGVLIFDMLRSTALTAPLVPVDEDRFLARWPDRTLNADAYVTFSTNGDCVTGLTLQAVSDTTDFSFDYEHLHFSKMAETP